jgi:hypothetical protein
LILPGGLDVASQTTRLILSGAQKWNPVYDFMSQRDWINLGITVTVQLIPPDCIP